MLIFDCSDGRPMNERIPITTGALWAESTVDGGGAISPADVAEEIWPLRHAVKNTSWVCHNGPTTAEKVRAARTSGRVASLRPAAPCLDASIRTKPRVVHVCSSHLKRSPLTQLPLSYRTMRKRHVTDPQSSGNFEAKSLSFHYKKRITI